MEALEGRGIPLPFLLLKGASEKIVNDDNLKEWLFERLCGSLNDRREFFDELMGTLRILANLESYLDLEGRVKA